jgi:hypothetical protein
MEVTDATDRQRFELHDGGALVGFIDYRADEASVVMAHAEVDPHFEGKGYGGAMVKAALDAVRDSGRGVVPGCSFVRAYIARHPEYQDLVVSRRG